MWRKPVRDAAELRRQAQALTALGPAAVGLLGVRGGALLLEWVRPGTTAALLPDHEATRALAQTLLRLWAPVPVPAPPALPDVARECAALGDSSAVAPLPGRLVGAAREALGELLATSDERCVLHGDLHHENLLWSAARQAWVAIDPHGVVGECGYDVGPLLINPWDRHPERLVDRRLDLVAEVLNRPRGRLAAWGLVRAVLAEAWLVQDRGRPDGRPLAVAEALVRRTAAG